MISFDFECIHQHRFEGSFKERFSYESQLEAGMIQCPVCGSGDIKRLYSGCSIQARTSAKNALEKKHPSLFEAIHQLNDHVRNNFENVGNDFADTARAIYYGMEERRSIYGNSSPEEIRGLIDDGIEIFPIPNVEKLNN
jgi:hypothetical protein